MKLLLLSILICQVAAIWPAPQSLTNGTSAVWLRDDFRVTYNGKNVRVFPNIPVTVDSEKYHYDLETEEILEQQVRRNLAIRGSGGGHGGGGAEGGSITSEDIVKEAVRRARDVIFAENFVPWKFHPRNEMNKYEPPAQGSAKTYLKTLQITQTGADNSSTFRPLAGQVDESYELKVAADGSASITAVSAIGVLHALQTFTQLWYTHSSGRSIYTNLAPLAIKDAPKFQHRGLNMDVSRNWMPKENILRMIDALAWNKFNRFHIHMTDAQSWPMDIPAMPELSQKGAYQTGLSYSPRDVEEIQLYAQYRGVEAYIEFDMPGHTSSIAFPHPELITAFRATPWEQYCAEPPCGALKLNSPAVYDFLKKLWSDVLPRVSPFTAYFHTGGDELNKLDYTLDETVNSGDAAVITPFLQKLVDFNHDAVRKNGLTPIVWEEMLLDWKLNLGKDVVVQTWIDDEALAKSTALGYKSLFGNYNFWYLDCGHGQWLNFKNGDSFNTYYPFNDYCSPLKNWRLMYSYDPTAHLSAEQKALVLGGECHIWAEQTDPVNLDSMVWPRAGAAAEVLWSGRQDSSGQNRSQIEAAPRLAEWRERLVARGIGSGPVQMIYCAQFGGSECSL